MVRPRRRLILSVLVAGFAVFSVITLRLAWEWKQALDDMNAMIVPTVALPTATPAPVQKGAAVVTQPTLEPTATPKPGGPVNILLLGTDARVGEQISRTDAVIVVHIDPQLDRVSMLSLPRDLWVDVPGYGKHKINAAYPIGERQLGTGYGAALAKETVGKLLNLQIEHFLLINFEGFKTLIDKLDGIMIDVPQEIDDPSYPLGEFSGDNRTIKVHFSAGPQWMDSERALIYARTRHSDSDFGRNQRQQQVLMAIFDRVRQRDMLTQLTSLDDYTGALRDYIRTDLTRSQMLSLASIGTRLHADDIQRLALESKMVIELKQPATFAADPKALRRLVAEMQSDSIASAKDASP